MHKKLNITATILSITSILFVLMTLQGWLHQLVRSLYPNLHPLEADEKYWPLEEVMFWLIPIFFLASLVLSIVSVSVRRSGYGIFLVLVSSVFVLLCVFAYWYAWEMGKAF